MNKDVNKILCELVSSFCSREETFIKGGINKDDLVRGNVYAMDKAKQQLGGVIRGCMNESAVTDLYGCGRYHSDKLEENLTKSGFNLEVK